MAELAHRVEFYSYKEKFTYIGCQNITQSMLIFYVEFFWSLKSQKLISAQCQIRAHRGDFGQEKNKRTCSSIRHSRVHSHPTRFNS